MSRPISRAEDRPSGFQPLSAPRSLTQQLFTRLAADITSGKLAPGSRLPTEQEMIAATGVSRTVVREAVAHLRAEGLVITRQGVGAFVAENVRRPFRIDFDESSTLREVLNVMELRTGDGDRGRGARRRSRHAGGAEKSHAIASRRSTPRSSAAKWPSIRISRSIARSPTRPAIRNSADSWNISAASSFRGRRSGAAPAPVLNRTHLDMFQKEHRAIVQAIKAGAVTKARAAMREHLLNSRRRHQKLADQLGVK